MADVFQVRVDTDERWIVRNSSMVTMGVGPESHPYHQHANEFVIVERGTWDPVTGDVITSVPVTPRSRMDAANVDPNSNIRIRAKFDRYLRRAVYHSHILFHEVQGTIAVPDIARADGSGVGADQGLPTQARHSH